MEIVREGQELELVFLDVSREGPYRIDEAEYIQMAEALDARSAIVAVPSTPTPVSTPPPPPGSAKVVLGSASVAPQGRAVIPITVTDITDPDGLGGYHIRVRYNPSEVKVVSVAGGDPPFQGAPTYNINNDEGWVVVVAVQVEVPGPANVVVARLEVEALGPLTTSSPLTLEVLGLVDLGQADQMTRTVVNCSLTVR